VIDKQKIQSLAIESLRSLPEPEANKIATSAIAKALINADMIYSDFEAKIENNDEAYTNLAWLFNYCAYASGIFTIASGDNVTDGMINRNYNEAKEYFQKFANAGSHQKARLVAIEGLFE
jgi:hypothetical protein